MNAYQTQLYVDLMNLCMTDVKKAFYHTDIEQDGRIYRIFNYRLASYTDFLQPNALKCRGMMFEVDANGAPLRLAAHTQDKFFNVNENPSTMGLDFSNPKQIMLKMDGSLISSFMHGNELRLKSKGSISSTQCVDAMKVLARRARLEQWVRDVTEFHGYTVNMEYCAPDNRIVIGYMEPSLTILNVINGATGELVDRKEFPEAIQEYFVKDYSKDGMTHEDVYNNYVLLDGVTGIEGYVIQLNSGQFVKCKCEWYLTQHRAKDSVNNPRRLFEAVLEEATDDLRSLFFDDPLAIKIIGEMEELVESIYNPLVESVESFHEHNKHLDRKSYAILGQQTFTDKGVFGLAMSKYLGQNVSYKEHMKKHYKSYGVKDEDTFSE